MPQSEGTLAVWRARARTSRRSAATLAAASLALLMGWRVVFGHNGVMAYEQKRADHKQLDSRITALTQENQHLSEHVNRLQSDPDEIVHEAREQLRLTRPGEIIYTLPADAAPAPPVAAASKK